VRMRLELAARKGWLRAYVLYVGDEPCAFWIGMLYGEIFVGEYTGYDPAFRDFSPGMFLMMQVIEGFCGGVQDTVKEVDFGLGNAEYKAALCGKNWIEASVFIFGPTLRGVALKGMRTMTVMVDVFARRVLASTKLLPRLKRAWRDRLAQNAQAQSKSKNSGTDPMARAAAPPEASS
jgi:CelD/BcsL family acetyltransferase involved in cellulose biosynthesis